MWSSQSFDVVVVGSGLAGLTFSLLAARYGRVALVTKGELGSGNSMLAQGGIAVAVGCDDLPQYHKEDTLRAGQGLCEEKAVDVLVGEAREALHFLLRLGVPFDVNDEGEFSLGREGAHSRSRVIHAGGDATGANVMRILREHVKNHTNIALFPFTHMVDLLVQDGECAGVVAVAKGVRPLLITGKATVLACGGLGHLYPYTTNAEGIGGEGYGIALRAGAQLRDMEFVQFHPTALQVAKSPLPLVSEAVRGAGAILVNDRGERFMEGTDSRLELASRDVVSRAIYAQLEQGRKVYLDIRPVAGFARRFPTITASCRAAGIEPEHGLIPVVPAVHYAMGGVVTDLFGRTSLPRLLAVGEISSTGVHGANRLASNSLLEALVFSRRAALALAGELPAMKAGRQCHPPYSAEQLAEAYRVKCGAKRKRLQRLMWDHAGIVRDESGLRSAKEEIGRMLAEAGEIPTPLGNMLLTASLIVQGALWRRETRGAHARKDYPATSEPYRKHTLFGGRHESHFAGKLIETSAG